jgi:Mg2+ and Co2+ transporter CorA
MNLVLRPLADTNDVTWSIIISILILLAGVAYYIYTIMSMAFEELDDERSDK